MGKKRGSRVRESDDLFSSEDVPGPSSQTSVSSQQNIRRSTLSDSQIMSSQNVEAEKHTELISGVIRYLFAADRNKLPIQKAQIIKNVLGGNGRIFRFIIDKVNSQLSEVFGYKLAEVESNKFILVNEIENDLPHLTFPDSRTQVLLYLVLVHIFMYGESCKEEALWDYLKNLGIVTDDNFHHEYFGDVKQLVTVQFVNQRYLEKKIMDKNNPSQVEYVWGPRAENELTYRSVLQFVAEIYGCSMNKWKLQYKTVVEAEQA
ncbi:PREDICTED: melanoma-associated antigen G1-like [Vollenhovia emeryi]|uniref:melanoma-associated antigen G1-like n=1 Tax=Vollenhovia emeryi TaxID=411798 RepID=UPI0005F48AF4|nr:PREDICTED: melanoma-associated antigen G1-like [Vollenhovia emeryi]